MSKNTDLTAKIDKILFLEEHIRNQKIISLVLLFVSILFVINSTGNWLNISALISLVLLIRSLYFDLANKVFRHSPLLLAKYLLCVGKEKEAVFWIYWANRVYSNLVLKSLWHYFKNKYSAEIPYFKKIIKIYRKQRLQQLVKLEDFDKRFLYNAEKYCNDETPEREVFEVLKEKENYLKKILI